jgi:hypothetical protein
MNYNIKKTVAVVGGRDFTDYERMARILNPIKYKIQYLVSGGAKGADQLAELYAKVYKVRIKIFEADWDTYGKKAGFLRNQDIVKEADVVIAFWNGISKGTRHTIELAKKNNKQLKVYNY